MSEAGLTSEQFELFARIAYEKAGIRLRPGKESLVAARVSRRIRALNLPDTQAYGEFLSADKSGAELVAFLDAISTNVTSFFREEAHFDLIERQIAAQLAAGRTRLRFWSAACSSGEEPYTLAMVVHQVVGHRHVDWRILATDISTAMLERATRAVYSAESVATVPEPHRRTAFVKTSEGLTITPGLRERVLFRRINLSQPPYPISGPLEVLLCRNVMIYFDDTVRQGIVREAERLLGPGGSLIISHTETLASLRTSLRADGPSVYRKEQP